MDDDIIDTLRYAQRSRRKQRTNHHYGKSIIQTARKNTKQYRRLRGTTTDFAWTPEPETYDNPWDAPIWRKWMGRAEEFWDARLQGRIFWEQSKNGSTRTD
ncbi:hypothetical protein HVTV-2_gp16 [Haloarcula virus HVTV-2]|uniref:Uncharacterized protein n=1 Tax=Haloarcula vallismortis tailed virus 1 TaxID=1262528 RepID=L7THR7_9CAUD|nr:hypothetical protein HVTV1_16 [Haloarcula vallismortis tailed virus 1]AGC34386.1 hypothetical protein HVTV1_16 [Haloarcula vallismortis tailed virus 1]UBF22823.1 hypothetical protein HVTV-2_gp16 [Haloarcula virus HVTV-2]